MQIIIAILLSLSLSSRAVTEEQKTIEILTYPIPGNPPWDPGSINQGIPGSEEAVIYISQKLADLGYKILVKGNPPADSLHSLPDANPRFVAVDYDDGIKRDIGIAWRTPTMVRELKNRTKKVYLWPHDIDYYSDVTDKDIDGYADVLWLSEWERQNWIARHPGFEKFNKIFGNGINPEQFQPVQERSNPYSCIYGSNYGRGLEILLDIWPKIKKQFPKATLDIYFGWTHWGLLSPQQELKMRIQIDQLSRNGLDVRHIGQVSHDTLNRAYEKASLWTYPCIMPETFCITALRAQMAGAVPVIIEGSALKETVRHGYKCATKEEYLATLIEAMKKIDKVTLEERTRMGDFILKDFTWKDIATKWKRLFDRQAETYKDDQYVDMTIPPSISNTNELDHNITIVSAFFDIGRRDWKKFTRGSDYYIDSFLNYLNLDYKMVVFVDDRYIDKILEHYEKSPHQNKIFIPINISWLEKNIYAWKQLEKARAIMNSAYYQDVFKARIANQYPENIYPEYDAINHAKIDFIDYAIKNNLVQDDFVCWSDFGYHKSIIHEDEQPVSVLNINGFNKDKMNFCLKSKLSEKDRDRLYTALIAPEVFAGNFFGGPKKLMGPFQNLYHECLEELYDHNISDDDQAVYLLCYFKKPEFFELYLSENKWPNALKFFQKPTLPI